MSNSSDEKILKLQRDPSTANSDVTKVHRLEGSSSSKPEVPDSPTNSTFSTDSRVSVPTIPPKHAHRTLVLCFDGTGDQFDDDNSNVVKFFSLLKKDDPKQQLVYYQAGIGTYNVPQVAKPWAAKAKKLLDMMIGIHLNAHVMEGYEFIMQNYEEGDKIFLFGFSRGAYTARALAGMIHKVGLLPKCNHQQIPFAYKMYTREDEKGWKQSALFKKSFSINVGIELLGVWDTVSSVGIIRRRLPFTTFNTQVKHFRHAVALDERRVRFAPSLFKRPTEEEVKAGLKRGEVRTSWWKLKPRKSKSLRQLEREYAEAGNTEVKQVWFAGCHCDVGGGAVENDVRNSLARIPLRWMIRECFRLETGILFIRDDLATAGLDHHRLWPKVLTRQEAAQAESSDFVDEDQEDIKDARSKDNDMLKPSKPQWWLMEYVPHWVKVQKSNDTWYRSLTLNRGRGRIIPNQTTDGIEVHHTVRIRMAEYREEETGELYRPQPKFLPGAKTIWVE